jgi:hypothetical protein
MIGSGVLLYFVSRLPSIQIAAIALISAVGAEALFAHVASRSTIRDRFSTDEPGDEGVTMAKLRRFHVPLTATTMLNMIGLPLVSAALAHSANSVEQLAGYQVAFTLVWLMRTTTYALPEIVITLYRDRASAAALRRFCLGLGLAATVATGVIWVTGLDMWFFREVLGAGPGVQRVAHLAFIAPLLTPLISAFQGYSRGMLTAHHLTVSRLFAVAVSISVLLATLLGVISLRINNVVTVGICLTVSMFAELLVLLASWRIAEQRNETATAKV